MQELPSRTIFLYDNVTKQSICEIMRQIIEINDLDDHQEKYIKEYEREPIQLRLNSPGGEASSMCALVEEMKFSKTPIVTIADGEIMSSAFLIFIAGHFRIIKRGSSIMMHNAMSGCQGSLIECKNDLKSFEMIEEYVQTLFKEFTKIPQKIIDKWYDTQVDRYFSIEECIKWKIADAIYGEKVENEE